MAGARGRPMVLQRFVHGAEGGGVFFQKRAAAASRRLGSHRWSCASVRAQRPWSRAPGRSHSWLGRQTGRSDSTAPVRADDLEHPDEIRVDLDPVRGGRVQIRQVELVAREVLADFGCRWPQDGRLARLTSLRQDERRLELRPGSTGGRGPAREVELGQRTGHREVVERRTARRLRGTTRTRRTTVGGLLVRTTPDRPRLDAVKWADIADCRRGFTIETCRNVSPGA